MKNKKGIAFYVFISITLSFVYIAIAVRPLGHEYQFIPEWNITVSATTIQPVSSGTPIYFKLGQTAGYFTEDGKITSLISFPFKVAISPSYYTAYTPDSSFIPFYHPDGSLAGTIAASGFPYFDGDRIFVFLPGGSSFAQCAKDGSISWTYGGTVPITAFGASAGGCIAGFADGTARIIMPDGKEDQHFVPGGSDLPVILGAAISSDGSYIATVSGRSRQRFVLAKRDGTQIKILYHQYLTYDDPYQKIVQFSKDSSAVYFCSAGLISVVGTDSKKRSVIKVPGSVISLREGDSCLFALSKEKNTYTVSVIEKPAVYCGSFSFTAETACIQTEKNMLFVGKDSTLSRISIVKD